MLALVERLRAFYGLLPLPPSSPFPLYVWEVLSVGTTPMRRDAAFNALRRIPALTPDAVARLPQVKIEAAVEHAGPMKDERVRALRAGADLFRREPAIADALAGPLPSALRAVRRIPHLGRASSLKLLLAAGHPVLPLDENALRVARRLGYGVDARRPVRVLRATRQGVAKECGRDVEALRMVAQFLAHHGLATCTEASPHCGVCPLSADCVWFTRRR